LKLKLLNLTGIAGGYLFLVLSHSEPPLKQQKKQLQLLSKLPSMPMLVILITFRLATGTAVTGDILFGFVIRLLPVLRAVVDIGITV